MVTYNKALTLSEIDRKINELKSIKALILKALNENSDDFETHVLKKYIEIQSVTEIAEYLNKQGHRIKTEGHRKGERKYISNDIKKIITDKSKGNNFGLIAKALFSYNKGETDIKSIIKLYNEITL